MSHPVSQPGPVESMMASDAASRTLGITLLDHGDGWGPVTGAAGADIVFVAPARLGDVLVAECRVRARYGRGGVYDATVIRDGDLIAEFRGRSSELRSQQP